MLRHQPQAGPKPFAARILCTVLDVAVGKGKLIVGGDQALGVVEVDGRFRAFHGAPIGPQAQVAIADNDFFVAGVAEVKLVVVALAVGADELHRGAPLGFIEGIPFEFVGKNELPTRGRFGVKGRSCHRRQDREAGDEERKREDSHALAA